MIKQMDDLVSEFVELILEYGNDCANGYQDDDGSIVPNAHLSWYRSQMEEKLKEIFRRFQ